VGDRRRLADSSAFANAADGPAQNKETENFVLVHYNAALADKAAEAAEFARSDIMAKLSLTPQWKGKIKIIIYRTQASTRRARRSRVDGRLLQIFDRRRAHHRRADSHLADLAAPAEIGAAARNHAHDRELQHDRSERDAALPA